MLRRPRHRIPTSRKPHPKGRPKPFSSAAPERRVVLNPNSVGAEDAGFIGRVGRFEGNGRTTPAQALQRRLFIIDESNDDVPGIRRILLADHTRSPSRCHLDQRITADLQGIMLAPREEVRERVTEWLLLLNRRDRRTAAIRPMTGMRLALPSPSVARVVGGRAVGIRSTVVLPLPPSTTLGVKRRASGGGAAAVLAKPPRLSGIGSPRSPAPVGQATQEPALFQGRNQAMDARLRLQVEGVLHLVERRGTPPSFILS